jgi:hypothetical protein
MWGAPFVDEESIAHALPFGEVALSRWSSRSIDALCIAIGALIALIYASSGRGTGPRSSTSWKRPQIPRVANEKRFFGAVIRITSSL